MFEEIVLKSMPLIKEAFLPNYREDDLLSFQRANKDMEGNYTYLFIFLDKSNLNISICHFRAKNIITL